MYKKIRKLSLLLFVATFAATQWTAAQQIELALASSSEVVTSSSNDEGDKSAL